MSADSEDPWVMYYVVRKDAPLTLEQAMSRAGAGAVLCADRFRGSERWAAWEQHPRKVALRASAGELESLRAQTECVAVDDILLALPPCRRSDRTPLVGDLKPYTDGPRPKEPPPPPDTPAMTYVVRPGVLRTAGKAMAQAGHAALKCDAELGPFTAWRAAGLPGRLRVESDWETLRARGVVVTDAGLTQVAPGTETVLALRPE